MQLIMQTKSLEQMLPAGDFHLQIQLLPAHSIRSAQMPQATARTIEQTPGISTI